MNLEIHSNYIIQNILLFKMYFKLYNLKCISKVHNELSKIYFYNTF